MFPWRNAIDVDKESGRPVYLQVASSIIREINEGRLLPGQKIPGGRVLGDMLGLNRKTVMAAMTELQSQGWIESFEHKGTFISRKIPKVDYKPLFYQKTLRQRTQTANEINNFPLLESLYLDSSGKKFIDDGVPDVRLAPLKSLFAHQRSILSKKAFVNLLKYYHVEGDLDLRKTLVSYLHRTRGITTETRNIFLTRGSQMGIYLAIAALIKPGAVCVTSSPGYSIVDNMIKHLGGKVEHISVDEEGIDTDELQELCNRKQIKLVYTTPHHHYPTTVTLTPARRIKLLQLFLKFNFYIIEDDYAYDFQYNNSPMFPLASLNSSGHVIYIGSFSKCLSPAIRIGYMVAPLKVMQAANKLRRITDRQGDPLLERALSEFIKCGDLQRHLKTSLTTYRQRRDGFCSLLNEHLSDYVKYIKPEGGMSVWLAFKKAGIAKSLLNELSNEGYLLDVDPRSLRKFKAVRIGFASLNQTEMVRFVTTLKNILSANLKK